MTREIAQLCPQALLVVLQSHCGMLYRTAAQAATQNILQCPLVRDAPQQKHHS